MSKVIDTALGVGLGFKPEHFAEALAETRPGQWWEVHPENHLVDGGPRWHMLQALRERHPLSLHSVSLSLAAPTPMPPHRLDALVEMNRRLEPALVSEHLAWSWWQGAYAPDLLPARRTGFLLNWLVQRVDALQNRLGRTIAIENPSHYVPLTHDWDEVDFLHALAQRSGCHLLIDVNNVAVSAHNLGLDPEQWLSRIDGTLVAEIHLAGHHPDPLLGDALWIDGHDTPISAGVWNLYHALISRIGSRPTLIERDDQIPPYAELQLEADRARRLCQLTLDTPLVNRAAKQTLSEPTHG
jgi:uncharacterized protein